jgi:hypothetical protein
MTTFAASAGGINPVLAHRIGVAVALGREDRGRCELDEADHRMRRAH